MRGSILSSASNIDMLRREVAGSVFTSQDAQYDEARLAWNRTIDQHPGAIVFAESTADVVAAVRYAKAMDLAIAVQATGHGIPKLCDGALLINMSRMNAVEIQDGIARAQGGAVWKDVLGPAQECAMAGMCGSAPHVGVVGYTLGGGFGLMLRQYGLAVDLVKRLELVTADGEVRTVSKTENPDLFWALRGGGGGFGVVTEIEFALVPNEKVFGGATIYPAERASEVLAAFHAWAQTAPESVTATIDMINFPPAPFVPEPLRGRAVCSVVACATLPQAEAEAILAPLRSLGGEIIDTMHEMPFNQSGDIYRDPVDPIPAFGQGVLLRDLPAEAMQAFVEAVGPMDRSPNLKIELRQLGGAMGRVPASETAIGGRREAKYLLYCLGIPMGPVTQEMGAAHAQAIFRAIEPYVICPGPLNFLGEAHVSGKSIQSVFTDEDFARLLQIKRDVDPTNRFRFASLGICLEA